MSQINTKKLEDLTSGLFFSGFLVGQLRFLPIGFLQLPFILFSMTLYLIGYVSWFISNQLNKAQGKEIKQTTPLAYKPFIEHIVQYRVSSLIGIFAAITSMISIWFPPLAIVAAGLFLLSNICWTVAEYNKLSQYRLSNDHRLDAQREYLKYALITTAVSFVALLGLTTAVFIPTTAPIVLGLTTCITFVLSAIAVSKWVNSSTKANQAFKQPSKGRPSYDAMRPILESQPKANKTFAQQHEHAPNKAPSPPPSSIDKAPEKEQESQGPSCRDSIYSV